MTERRHTHRPKGSYPHPDGGCIVEATHVTKSGRRLKIIAKPSQI